MATATTAAERRRRRPGLKALLAGGALALPPLLAGVPVEAQQAPLGGTGPLGLFGPNIATPSPFPAPATPGVPDASRFWLPQLYPDLPVGGAPPEGAPPQVWSIRPSIDLTLGATDNVRNSSRNRRSDFYTIISPQITVAADTPRLVGALTYQPRLRYYLNADDQNRIDQSLNGQATAALVEDLFYIDLSANAQTGSAFGNVGDFGGSTGGTNINRQNRIQTTSYRVSPYLLRRYGGFATARIGYAFSQLFQSGRQAFLPGQTQPFFTPQDYNTHEFYGRLSSGEDFGRLGWDLSTSWMTFEGSGVYDGAHRNVTVLATRYQLTREWALTAEGGWQDERYNGIRPVVIRKPVWSVGVRWTPDEDSYLSVRYGQRDGFESWTVDGALLVGVRTRLVVGYSEQIGAPFQRPGAGGIGGLPPGLTVDAFGNVVDAVTGVPVSLLDDRLRSSQSNIFRTRRASVAVSQAWERDTFTGALVREHRTPEAVASGTTAFEETTHSASLAWTHELEPGLALTSSGRYGLTERPGTSQRSSYYLQAGLSKVLSPSLLGTLQYQFSYQENAYLGGNAVQNTVLVTLRQQF